MIKLIQGDCLDKLKELEDNSIDSVVTDPPYGLSFMGKKWDYDVPSVEFWKEVYRVLKPGGHILSFGGTRTYHRMVVNIEDAGFEIRDQVMWLYGSGFPKSHNIGKAVDKIEGNEREVVGTKKQHNIKGDKLNYSTIHDKPEYEELQVTKGTSQYEGWGTALKPAQEIIAVAQKPEDLEGTALNLIYIIKSELWKLYVKIVESSSELNQVEQKEVLDTALCLVEKNTNIQVALQGLMDMSQLRLMENICWNTVGLWSNILEDLYQKMSRYTTSTKLNLIIDLKTLKSLEWQNILENIIQVKNNQIDGVNVNVLTAEVLFNALNLKLKDIQRHSVEDNVIYKEDKMDCLNEPICLARKPLSEKSVAENVLKWGTGGINIDGCRVATTDTYHYKNGPQGNSFSVGKEPDGKRTEPVEMNSEGRFPANLILECICDEVIKGEKGEVKRIKSDGGNTENRRFGNGKGLGPCETNAYNDKGDIHTNPMCPCRLLDEQSGSGASRFFFKASYNFLEQKEYKKKNECQQNNYKLVQYVEQSGLSISQITELIAQTNVEDWIKEKLVLLVKSALNLSEKCTMYIVANIVAIATENMASPLIQDFITELENYILIQNLAHIVEIQDNIDTTPTTQSLMKLFGSVLPVIEKNIKQDTLVKEEQKSEQNKSTYRFVYQAKVSKKERNLGLDGFEEKKKEFETTTRTNKETADKFGCERKGTAKNTHPTLKPINLMTYLCRLITPEGGIVLDPFMGSGSTGIAALLEGFRFVGMELDPDYFKIAEARINNWEQYRKLLKK